MLFCFLNSGPGYRFSHFGNRAASLSRSMIALFYKLKYTTLLHFTHL
jgi:hypothetical protein